MVSITRLLLIANVLATGVLSARMPRHRGVGSQNNLGKRTTGSKQKHCTRRQSNSTSTVLTVASSTPVASKPTTTIIPQVAAVVTTKAAPTTTVVPPVVHIESEPATTPAPPPPAPTKEATTSVSGTSGGLTTDQISQFLSLHNSIRSQHDANPLTWNADMANAGQGWANKCVFQHSQGELGPWGENIAAGTGSSYDVAAAMSSWTSEISQYVPSAPVASHYTQVVWKGSQQVGCGLAPACSNLLGAGTGPAKFFVCEYSPAGNVDGEFAENVS